MPISCLLYPLVYGREVILTAPRKGHRLCPIEFLRLLQELLFDLISWQRGRIAYEITERVIQELCKLKKVRLKGDFYSPEFNRKFRDENAAFSFEEDKNRKGHYQIYVNDIPLVLWFRQKTHEWRNG